MRRILPLLLSFSILTACGTTLSDKELSRMHDALGEKITTIELADRPAIAATEANLDLTIYSEGDILQTDIHSVIEARGRYDVRSPKSPLIEQVVKVQGQTLDSKTKKLAKDSLQATLNVRVTEKTLSLNISDLMVTAPASFPQPFIIPSEYKSRWYGATFADVNRTLAKRGRNSQTIEQMLDSLFGPSSIGRGEDAKLWNSLHFWDGAKMQTEHGITSIEVVSNKEKFRESMVAIVSFMRKATGESWRRSEENPRFKSQLEELTTKNSDFMKQFPTIRGTIRIDAVTAEFQGFTGDVLSQTGAKLATVSLELSKEHDLSFTLTNVNKPDLPLLFTKRGEAILLTVGADTVASGTISKTRLALTVTDPRTEKQAFTMDIAITSAAKNFLELGRSTVELPGKGIVTVFDFLKINNKDGVLDGSISGSVQKEGKAAALFSLTFGRRAIEAFSLEKPAFVPFEQFQADITTAFMGSAAAAVPTPRLE